MSPSVLFTTIVLAPLIGSIINGARFRSQNGVLAGSIATGAMAVSFASAIILVLQLANLPADARVLKHTFFQWITVGDFSANAAFLLDPINAIMILVITGVGTLIHLFSVGYMSHDERPAKYFSYLNLFVFNMLLLVLGDNLLVMFVGWEGVGLCSYLLIGFWFKDAEKAAAGMKAFITNRIGDAGFLLGIFLLFTTFGTVNFYELSALVPGGPEMGWLGPITLSCIFLFIGAAGKSAQIPLYVWLPDAMAGPTPVSALIHAATMVTAGVYMIIRLNAVYLMAPNALMVVAIIGAATALFAATIGLAQWDIKKVLAYSTVSQLGFMFLACGVGAFGAALFHLMTHAFFKALMFLGSGSVIHAMEGEQDIRKMGGLSKKLKWTYWTFFFGWLAIIGIPPFAGFFSKDEILWMTFAGQLGNKGLWVVGAVAAICTAFYMTRLMALVFWGKSRVPSQVHPHESPPSMLIPLVVLSVLSIVGGWIGIPHVIGAVLPGHPGNWLEGWLKNVIVHVPPMNASAVLEWSLMGISTAAAGVSAGIAYEFYIRKPETPKRIAEKFKATYKLVSNKYFVDEVYFSGIINPIIEGSKGLWAYIDVNFVDKATYWVSDLVKSSGSGVRALQTGNFQQYALYIVMGLVLFLLLVVGF